jgi:RNA polymerase-binding transcription factor DksA
MAKAKKKSTAKVAKKKAPKKVKAKSKAKPGVAKKKAVVKAKKVVSKPTKKAVKKIVSKATPKKAKAKVPAVPKKSSIVKKEIKMSEKKIAPKVEKVLPTTVSSAPPAAKPALPQLNMFQMPNQRPIAHKPVNTPAQDSRSRYSDEELKEFEKLIQEKLEKAKEEYKILKETLNRNNDEGTDATSGGNTKVLEDGAETAEKENLSQLAARQQKYITNLENALIRIKNGTYGVCSVTGKLISKERLIAVPHTTQSIEGKLMQSE